MGKICPKCGFEFEDGVEFCVYCGGVRLVEKESIKEGIKKKTWFEEHPNYAVELVWAITFLLGGFVISKAHSESLTIIFLVISWSAYLWVEYWALSVKHRSKWFLLWNLALIWGGLFAVILVKEREKTK
jgi:hypothetical protein